MCSHLPRIFFRFLQTLGFLCLALFLPSPSLAGDQTPSPLDICPDPNQVGGAPLSGAQVNPLAPQNTESSPQPLPVQEVGYQCQVPTRETLQYVGKALVTWTLVAKEEGRPLWAAQTGWGPIYVGAREPGYHNFFEAQEVCDKTIKIPGVTKPIQMTIPDFGLNITSLKNPLNFELLTYLNYTAVMPHDSRLWFWSSSANHPYNSGTFGILDARIDEDPRYTKLALRCVGR